MKCDVSFPEEEEEEEKRGGEDGSTRLNICGRVKKFLYFFNSQVTGPEKCNINKTKYRDILICLHEAICHKHPHLWES